MKQFCSLLACCSLGVPSAFADTLVFSSGRTVSGIVLQTNDVNVLMLTDYGALNYSPAIIKEIKMERAESVDPYGTNRIPDSKNLLLRLSRQPWATNLKQIPATVIDTGIMRNVPYVSFQCGEDYEVNIYGDLDHPAGIEVGVYRKLIENALAKANCAKFMADNLGQATDKEAVRRLDQTKDLKTVDGLTLEITPPSAADAYMGWWISAYLEEKLNRARASADELKGISVAKADVSKASSPSQNPSAWSAADLKFARPSLTTITFTTSSGTVTNAQVKPYVEGVSLIWSDTNTGSGGIVKLSDLPEELRARLGYDPGKAAFADTLEKEKQQAPAQQQVQVIPGSSSPSYNSPSFSGTDRVYVRGYTKKDGTYVQPYTRSSPQRR